MSIIAASLYRNGKRIGPVSLDQPVRCATDRSEFVWIGLFEPSEAELRQLQENYGLHPLAIEDALLAHQLPKLDISGNQLLVVLAQPISRWPNLRWRDRSSSCPIGRLAAKAAPAPDIPLPALTEVNCSETGEGRNAAGAQGPPPGCCKRTSEALTLALERQSRLSSLFARKRSLAVWRLLETARAGSASLEHFGWRAPIRFSPGIAPAGSLLRSGHINQRSLAVSEAILARGDRT